MWGYGLDRAGKGQGQVVGTCDSGNEPLGSIKCGEFLDQLRTGQLLKEDSAEWSDNNNNNNNICKIRFGTEQIVKCASRFAFQK